ncbi:MAG: NADH-quinone oxidoreductase subunit K [Gammaproteobacteria bacterium]|nr:NADH-quinone oxidoreductase subunit K [Gammaproteobacteria bacterium]
MTSALGYAIAGALLVAMGLAAMLLHHHLVRRLIAFNIMGGGVFLVLLGLAPGHGEQADPVAQALILTGIVVAVAATGLALALARRLHQAGGDVRLDHPSSREDDDDQK